MNQLVPFESAQLPAYLANLDPKDINSDLTAHASGFPVVSIKGKVFAIVRDGERQIVPNPKDPDSPASSIEVVLIKANKNVSKVFYSEGYDPVNSEGQKPDCYSNDGVTPESDSKQKQANKCAVCKHNEWGSKINEKGVATKGKSCADTVRMAIAPSGQLNDPMLLRVPAASIRNLGEYGQMLTKRGVAYSMVVTKVSFDQDAESPKLTFKPVGFLPAEDFNTVKETMESSTVTSILNSSAVAAAAPVEESPADEPVTPPVKAETKPARTKTVKAETPKAEVKAPPPEPEKSAADFDIDLDGINFDD